MSNAVVAEQRFCCWKNELAEVVPREIEKLKQLEEKNRGPKGLVVDLAYA